MSVSQSEQEMTAFFASRGFGLRIGFGERPAVAVIDFMNGFTDASMPLGANLDREIEATRQVLTAARESQTPIYYTACIYEEPDYADAGVWRLKQTGIRSLGAGTRAVELDSRLERRSDEAIIVKKYASAFFGTDFITRLNARRVDTLIIAGCTTSGCVRATAVDALQLGLRPVVVREAVGDRAEAPHRQSLFDLEQKYADVVGVDEVVDYLRSRVGEREAAAVS
ncbi:MAG TPA: isochorismatase family protein [Chloroflexota bacterium]|jgi:nicotinamidase-related amidase|nr:isochorismatase family protein [Chloroflexota bacterium]